MHFFLKDSGPVFLGNPNLAFRGEEQQPQALKFPRLLAGGVSIWGGGSAQLHCHDIMAGQPTPPVTYPPPRNKGLIRPYFWGGYVRGGWLTSHDDKS